MYIHPFIFFLFRPVVVQPSTVCSFGAVIRVPPHIAIRSFLCKLIVSERLPACFPRDFHISSCIAVFVFAIPDIKTFEWVVGQVFDFDVIVVYSFGACCDFLWDLDVVFDTDVTIFTRQRKILHWYIDYPVPYINSWIFLNLYLSVLWFLYLQFVITEILNRFVFFQLLFLKNSIRLLFNLYRRRVPRIYE